MLVLSFDVDMDMRMIIIDSFSKGEGTADARAS